MKFCSECAAPVQLRWLETENRQRHVCTGCGIVHYENPKVLVSCMAHCGGRIAMCRRAHEPSVGLWTPPSGFVEKGETLESAAAREAAEEAGLRIDPADLVLYAVTTLPFISEVYITFRVEVREAALVAGAESLEVALFDEEAMPWGELAFPEMRGFMRLFFREMASGEFSIHLSQADAHGRARRAFRIVEEPPPR